MGAVGAEEDETLLHRHQVRDHFCQHSCQHDSHEAGGKIPIEVSLVSKESFSASDPVSLELWNVYANIPGRSADEAGR